MLASTRRIPASVCPHYRTGPVQGQESGAAPSSRNPSTGLRFGGLRREAAFGQQLLEPIDLRELAAGVGGKRGHGQAGFGQRDRLGEFAFRQGHGGFGAEASLHLDAGSSRS